MSTHGGKREGAGRPPGRYRSDPAHRARPALDLRHPVHVVLRVMPYVTELRTRARYNAVRKTMERYLGVKDFRIVHVSIQDNHLHLIVEAADRAALTKYMQSFAINCARAINRVRGVGGKVFAHRYHATQLRDARQARNAVSYVLNNWRKHHADLKYVKQPADVPPPYDLYASGVMYRGWKRRFEVVLPEGYVPLPVSPPHTRLLMGLHDLDPYAPVGPRLWAW